MAGTKNLHNCYYVGFCFWGGFVSVSLYEHNRIAYEKAIAMLDKTKKAAVIHPTGTGKSFIAFKLCEDYKDKKICWISPSSYIFKTQLENIRRIAPDFSCKNIFFVTYSKLSLMTEEEIEQISPSYIILDEFHRAGASEWGKGVSRLIDMYKDAYLLGLSATNIRYLDNQRNMADELFDGNVASQMTLGEAIVRGILNPPTYVISMYSYKEELKKYETRLKSSKYNSTREKIQCYIDDLRRTLDMADGLPVVFKKHMKDKNGKYIVFCADYEHMQDMLSTSKEWFVDVDPLPHIYIAYSNNAETSKAFEDFKNDNSNHLKLLYCIDMLNEGIHVDDVSGVVLLRPTISPIIYKQQIGRALSASKCKDTVIFDIVNNFENLYSIEAINDEITEVMAHYRCIGNEEAIVNERFDVIDELRDCRRLFNELEKSIDLSWDEMFFYAEKYFRKNGNLNVPKRYKTPEGYSLGNWVATQRMVYSGKRCGTLDDERIKKLTLIGMRWENKFDLAWERFYEECKEYYKTFGNLDVDIGYASKNGYKLGKKMCQIRSYRKNNVKSSYLSDKRTELLDALGMIWDVDDYVWDTNFNAAREYYDEHSHLDVPREYVTASGIRLGLWIDKLRVSYRKGKIHSILNEEKVSALSKIGMRWNTKYEVAWENVYREAKSIFDRLGHLDVSCSYVTETGYKLGRWISRQRSKFYYLDDDKQTKLQKIGIVGSKVNTWERNYMFAKEYYEKHSSLDIPLDYVENGVWLGKWLNEQKQIYLLRRDGKRLTQSQVKKLEDIGIRWKSKREEMWDVCFDAVVECCAGENSRQALEKCMLPEGKTAMEWINIQRKQYKKNKLPDKKIKQLNDAGISLDNVDKWSECYKYARRHYEEYGNLRVGAHFVTKDGFNLGGWISNQRTFYKKSTLDKSRKKLLDEIGMVWDMREMQWTEVYEDLVDYFVKHGNTNLPKNCTSSNGTDLYEWLRTQHRQYKNGKLDFDKISKLKKLNVKWLSDDKAGTVA